MLRPKALYQGTMLPTRNINYGRGRTFAPATFVALYAGFELLSLKQQLQRKPGSWHWHIIAERRP